MLERIDFVGVSVADRAVEGLRVREAMQREIDWKRKALLKDRVLGFMVRENCGEEEMGFGVWEGLGVGWREEERGSAMRE